MEAPANFDFDTLYWSVLLAVVAGGALWEVLAPRRPEVSGLGARWLNNGLLTGLNFTLLQVSGSLLLVVSAWWAQRVGVGLFAHLELGLLFGFLISLIAFEVVHYWQHRLYHKIPWLWRLHAVHHSDTEVDFTTAQRHHPLEFILGFVVDTLVILLLGLPPLGVLILQVYRVAITVWSHSNIYVPEAIERKLRLLLVTPDFHRLHHASLRTYTDSNFAASLPLLDYLFGTSSTKPFAEHSEMELGLESFREPADQRIGRLLLMPFVWRARPSKPSVNVADNNRNTGPNRSADDFS